MTQIQLQEDTFYRLATPPPCTQFVCDVTNKNPVGKCLNETRVCDGFADCVDTTDESNDRCNYTSTPPVSTSTSETTGTPAGMAINIHSIAFDESIFSSLACSSASDNYQAFTLDSSLVSTVTSTQISDMANKREISPSHPLVLSDGKPVQIYAHFPANYEVMEVTLLTTVKLTEFYIRTQQSLPQILGVLVAAPNNSYFEYLATVVAPSTQPAKQVFITILPTAATNIIGLTIKACTGKII